MGSVFTILRDYVQPDSTLSLDEAVDRAAEFYTDGYQKNSPFNETSIVLGDQIPYDNPAHTKLAHSARVVSGLPKASTFVPLHLFKQSNTLTDVR
jgi:hypothetical protein